MRSIFTVILAAMSLLSFTNCVVSHSHSQTPVTKTKKVPPGQAKKANGDQSAKKYAPGHNK